jgi:hypothetical protein
MITKVLTSQGIKHKLNRGKPRFLNEILVHDQRPFEMVIFYSMLYFRQYLFRFRISIFYPFALCGGFLDDDMGFSCFQQEFGSLWILGHISILNHRTAMFSKA